MISWFPYVFGTIKLQTRANLPTNQSVFFDNVTILILSGLRNTRFPRYIVIASVFKVLAKGSNEEQLDKNVNTAMCNLCSDAIKNFKWASFKAGMY